MNMIIETYQNKVSNNLVSESFVINPQRFLKVLKNEYRKTSEIFYPEVSTKDKKESIKKISKECQGVCQGKYIIKLDSNFGIDSYQLIYFKE